VKRKLLMIITFLVVLIGCEDASPTSMNESDSVTNHIEVTVDESESATKPIEATVDETDSPTNQNENGKSEIVDEMQQPTHTTTLGIFDWDVVSMTLHSTESDLSISVPAERYFMITQGLHWMDVSIAKSDRQEKAFEPVAIHIETKTDTYEFPYDLATNRLYLEEEWVYASDYTLLIMHGLLDPQSEIGIIDTLLLNAWQEFERNPEIEDTHFPKFDQSNVNHMDYSDWEIELRGAETTTSFMYYDSGTEEVQTLSIYKSGIIALNRQLLFTDPMYKTPNGVHVGMSREEALIGLGEPSIKLDSHWGYRVGDYTIFHLYFDDNKIKWISLTMPL